MFKNVGIIGLGLIGGSLAKAMKKYNLAKFITAYNRTPSNLEDALRDHAIDMASSTINSVFKDCEIIFLCLPVDVNVKIMTQLKGIVHSDCIITDVSSTKSDITEAMRELNINFIGGHPMTGSEKTGYKAANELIFENAYYIYTTDQHTDKKALNQLIDFTKAIKSIPIVMDVNKHDFVTATISHAPHVIASSLVNVVKKLDFPEKFMHDLAAGGFKSITRIASASPDVWQQICSSNQDNIATVIDCFIEDLQSIKAEILKNDTETVYSFFEAARDYRNSFTDHKPSNLPDYYAISIDVLDETGIIAKVANELSKHQIGIKNMGIVNNREHVCGILEIVFYTKEHMVKAADLLTSMYYQVYYQ